jgi:hypothetical protein
MGYLFIIEAVNSFSGSKKKDTSLQEVSAWAARDTKRVVAVPSVIIERSLCTTTNGCGICLD